MTGMMAARAARRTDAGNIRTAEPPGRSAAMPEAVGNQALQTQLRAGAVPAGLKIGQPDDPAESAANNIAAATLAGAAPGLPRDAPPAARPGTAFANRPGRPLEPGLRGFFEPRMATRLDAVRVHDDAATAATARHLGADAFAEGADIGFAAGMFRPQTGDGKRLLAHELGHVVQGDSRVIRRQTPPDGATDPPASSQKDPQNDKPDAGTGTREPDSPGGEDYTVDPATIDVKTLTNQELIEQTVNAAAKVAAAKASDAVTEAWMQLQREITDERGRRVKAGFIFLAEQSDTSPAALYQLRGGSYPGTFQVVTADLAAAMGAADVTLTGPLFTLSQIQAYISTLGYRQVTGPEAEKVLADPDAYIKQLLAGTAPGADGGMGPLLPPGIGIGGYGYDPGAGAVPGQDDRPWRLPPTVPAARGIGRYSMGDIQMAQNFPMGLSDQNFRGRAGEVSMLGDWQGMMFQDLNTRPWIDRTGVTRTGSFPVLDIAPGGGMVPRILGFQPISITTSGSADYSTRRSQYMKKIGIVLDVSGRGPATAPNANLVLAHLQQASGQAGLTPGTPAYNEAMARYLSDTMFAVPDGDLARVRTEVANPNASPASAGGRMMTRRGYQELYNDALAASPITVKTRDGTPITVKSLAELAALRPSDFPESLKPPKGTPLPALAKRIDEAELARAFVELGKTASSRVIASSGAADLAAAADMARSTPGGGPVEPTRVLDISSSDSGYIGQRVAAGLGDKRGAGGAPGSGGTRWTTAAQSDPVLSLLRNFSGDQTLTRSSSNFAQVRRAYLNNALVAVNADDVARLTREIGGLNLDAAGKPRPWGKGPWSEMLSATMSDNPVTVEGAGGQVVLNSPDALEQALKNNKITPEQYRAAQAEVQTRLSGRVTSNRQTTTELTNLETLRNEATSKLGAQADTAATPEMVSQARRGTIGATASTAGRAGAGGFIIGVITTAGTMYIDERKHPDWALEMAKGGGTGALTSGAQAVIEDRVLIALEAQALKSGVPMSAWGGRLARGGSAGVVAFAMEEWNMRHEGREHSDPEEVLRPGRAVAIGVTAGEVGAAAGTALGTIAGAAFMGTEIGAAAGTVVPGAGNVVGAVVGFLVGAAVGIGTALVLEHVVPGGADYWQGEYDAEQAKKAREAEARRRAAAPKVVDTFGDKTGILPVMSSPAISPEEQEAFVAWITLMSMATPEPPAVDAQ